MKKYKVGVIGAGSRSYGWIRDCLSKMPNVEITTLCDVREDRLQEITERMEKENHIFIPHHLTDAHQVIASDDVEVVLVFSGWQNHMDAAMEAMEAGKPVAIEVGGAYSVEQCWRLVHTYEKTKTPFMMLENCCYGEYEMTVTHMARQGIFGEIVHCAGGYCHDLREELAGWGTGGKYRGNEYHKRNCENYPTHEVGPIAKLLDINNGNLFVSLVSVASKSAGMREYLKDKDHPLKDATFAQGDVFTTLIKCANGETVQLTLDTTLPRYYSRDFTVRGTKGMYEERTNSVFLDEAHHAVEFDWKGKDQWNNMDKEYMEQYRHPLWKKYREEGLQGGHGGMDGLVMAAFFDALEKDLPMPVDVYDTATWMAITALSEQSIALGSAPVAFPDFTCGKWIIKKPPVDSMYNLL